ncbi:MAG TPA: Uma2 family endonuclease [Thermoanaerobaculia bacterium]|jgi:Uma2 family endonuclease
MAVPIQKGFLTIDEFKRAWEDGAFPPDARLELIRGEIVEMTPIGNPHAGSVRRLTRGFSSRLSSHAVVDVQNPISLGAQKSLPQPDLCLLRLREDFYSTSTPTPADVLLVVEVADSTLAYDRNVKIPLYAEAGIPEAWLVALSSDTIFAYRRPFRGKYQDVRAYRRGESISPEAFPDTLFAVDEILG